MAEDHSQVVKFGQNLLSGFRGDVQCISTIVDALTDTRTHIRTMDDGQRTITKAHLEDIVLMCAKKNILHIDNKVLRIKKAYANEVTVSIVFKIWQRLATLDKSLL